MLTITHKRKVSIGLVQLRTKQYGEQVWVLFCTERWNSCAVCDRSLPPKTSMYRPRDTQSKNRYFRCCVRCVRLAAIKLVLARWRNRMLGVKLS
jgi:hypothetical protein